MSRNATNELNAAIDSGLFTGLDHLTDVVESPLVSDATKTEFRAAFNAGQLNGVDRLYTVLAIGK